MIHIDEGLIADTCPVCRIGMKQMRLERIIVQRNGHAAGANPRPVTDRTPAMIHEETFQCKLSRSRVLLDGRWNEWIYDDNEQCTNAQRVVLGLDMKGISRE